MPLDPQSVTGTEIVDGSGLTALRSLVSHLRRKTEIGERDMLRLAEGIEAYLAGEAPLDRALGLSGERGRRTARTVDLLDRRDQLVLQLAADHYAGRRVSETAALIWKAWGRYAGSGWPRDRLLAEVPASRSGKPEAIIWEIMKLQDLVPSERSIRRILATS